MAKLNIVEKPADAGSSPLSSFRYGGGWCFVTLENGVSGIVGTTEQYPFSTMLSLKGQGVSLSYSYRGKNGEHDRYWLEWKL